MLKQIDYTLIEEQLIEIEQAIKQDPRAEVVRLATAIRLLHQGHTASKVANLVSARLGSIQN